MAQGQPRAGEKYLHFKNRLYQVITVAEHSETGENLVIYQALYGGFQIYARPLEMFVEEVDHQKYPGAGQRFRFMLADAKQLSSHKQEPKDIQVSQEIKTAQPDIPTSVPPLVPKRDEATEREVPSLLIDFFDADTYEEKYRILSSMKDLVTNNMINNMAVVLDIVIPEGDLETRYEELKRCIRTYQKYETSRLH